MYAYIHDGPGTDPAMRHLRSAELTAPRWPGRQNGGGHRPPGSATRCRWTGSSRWQWARSTRPSSALHSSRSDCQPARPLSPPPRTLQPSQRRAACDCTTLRHTFAVMQLMAGTHYMQVSKWLGHSTFTLTLNTYGDWIPDEEGGTGNDLPEPPKPQANTPAVIDSPAPESLPGNVVPFRRRSAG